MISKFVTLSDYCILEYMMTPPGDPSPTILNTQYYLVDNQHLDLYQLYNTEAYSQSTKNSRELSVVPIGNSKLVRVDITDTPIYTAYDPKLTETSISPSLSSFTIMDTMRFHFASGFNFTEVENLILGARLKLNDLKQLQIANVLMTAQTAQDLLTFNPKPLFLANTIYDKYIDIKVPTPSYLDEDFAQFGSNSFEYAITGGSGLIVGSPITVSLVEANYEPLYADNNQTYEVYRVVNYYEGSVSQVNEFDSLGATIQEATDGDYIEFFATWNGGFAEDLISTLNAKGPDNQWIFVHQLQVYEQIGTALVPSGNFMVYQEDNFDTPLAYRPILKEAGFAVSMSIDYTLRLLNKKTGDQIIRTGSMSLFNPNKYGKNLAKLELADKPQSLKVYNKIVQTNLEISNLFSGGKSQAPKTVQPVTIVQEREVKVGVPIFYKQTNIRASQKNALIKNTDGTSDLIFGQGELTLPIDPTDNYFKFTVYEVDPNNPTKQKAANLNLNSKFTLNFGKDAKYTYESVKDPSVENPSVGEIAFRIPKDQAKKILDTTDQLVYISLIAEDGTESLLYTAKWLPSSEYAAILKAQDAAKNALLNDPTALISSLQAQISDLQAKNNELNSKLRAQSVKEVKNQTRLNINPIAASNNFQESARVNNLTDPNEVRIIDMDTVDTTTRRSQKPINTRIQ